MKTLMIMAVVAVAIVGLAFYQQKPTSYEANTVEVVTNEVRVSELASRIADSQEQAKAEVEAKAQTAYQSTYDQEMLEVELAETTKYRAEIEQREEELAKQSKNY